jgi:hypothetical protein
LHDSHRRISGQAVEQFVLDALRGCYAHVDHQGEFGLAGGVG